MNGVNRSKARRLMRIGQAAAVLLAGGAVLAMTFEPGLPPAPVIVAQQPTDPTPAGPAPEPEQFFDVSRVATVLNEAAGVEPRFPDEAPPPQPTDDSEPAPVATTTKSTSNLRFLGGFFSDKRSLAIIAGGGKQRMVREGDEIDFGFTINTVTPDFVEIERNGVVERLDREVATSAMVGSAMATASPKPAEDSVAPGTVVSESARDRLRNAREQAAQRAGTDRAKRRADYERQRQERLEELREQGVEIDESEWRRDD